MNIFYKVYNTGHPNSQMEFKLLILKPYKDFPGGPGVKNLPDNAGDTGSIPGPGRSDRPRSN